jgi:uncharacterized membrane protein YeaQ/YmgE (transglycosylase-associated protein family)
VGFVSWIFVGLIAGLLAKWIMPGAQKAGLLITIGLGVVGGFVGGWIMSMVGGTGLTGFNIWTILVATGGAVLVLFLYGVLTKK